MSLSIAESETLSSNQNHSQALNNLLQVRKRDGSLVPWNSERITRAIALAYYSEQQKGVTNPHRDDPAKLYGLDCSVFQKVRLLTDMVERVAAHRFQADNAPDIESIQDIVETCLAAQGDWAVARTYVIYRSKKADLRSRRYDGNGLSDFIAVSRYSRYRPELGRREVWQEAVERVRNMHLRRFADRATRRLDERMKRQMVDEGVLSTELLERIGPVDSLSEEIWQAFASVSGKEVLPSMRSLQFGGPAIEASEARIYNCSFSYADRSEFFRECFYLLLCGVGVGFSVQKCHVEKLPALPVRGEEMDLKVQHYTIEDNIEGWSNSIDVLLRSYYEGFVVEFNYDNIRGRGEPIRTAGGKAPGHLPLKKALLKIEDKLKQASGRKLRPIEVYDIVMYIAGAVLAGGVRRSATLCLFSLDDEEMATAKTGTWFETNPQRAYSNNSALLTRSEVTKEAFLKLFERQKEFGEPGFYFSAHPDYGANPCVEIGLYPKVVVRDEDIQGLRKLGYHGELKAGTELSGWQMCNLTTINGRLAVDEANFYRLCRNASIIGTLQAAYTHIPYLGPVTRFINERESLLGVSICGILDNPDVLLDKDILSRGAEVVSATNLLFSRLVDINPAARTTCVKPEGTASLLLECGSGIHPHHSKRYFRRVQINRLDPVYSHFRGINPHMCEKSVYNPSTDDVITFPVEAPQGALCRHDLSALDFLEKVRFVQKYWVEAGTAHENVAPGLRHNVSNTVSVREDEWDAVEEHIWANRDHYTGIALLHDTGDKVYAQAPREEVATQDDIVKWNKLEYQPVDYRSLHEDADHTKLQDVVACAGGACEIR
jgi:ribonucleoside-triphosphate reductase (thioredoxin)